MCELRILGEMPPEIKPITPIYYIGVSGEKEKAVNIVLKDYDIVTVKRVNKGFREYDCVVFGEYEKGKKLDDGIGIFLCQFNDGVL